MADRPSTTPTTDEIIPYWYRPLSVTDYHHMLDAEILEEDDRCELLDGWVARMAPQSMGHVHAINYLNELLVRTLPLRFQVRCQVPLTLARSEPEPDFAIVERRLLRNATHHPATATLVIEVSFESLLKDRAKSAVYAEAGVKEYWIIDVEHRCVEVRRRPKRAQRMYVELTTLRRGQLASPLLRGVAVPVAALFRKPSRAEEDRPARRRSRLTTARRSAR